MRLIGVGGTLFSGPYVAATLGSWTLTRDGEDWALKATVFDRDAYWSVQPVTRATLIVAGRQWAWRTCRGEITGSTVTAQCRGGPAHL